MQSVRKKLFIQIGSLVILLVGLMILINTLFLETYYTNRLKGKLVENYQTINALEIDSYEVALKELITIEAVSNVDIIIADGQDKIKYSSKSYFMDPNMVESVQRIRKIDNQKFRPLLTQEKEEPRGQRPPIEIKKLEDVSETLSFYYAYGDPLFDTKMLILAGKLKSGDFIELKVPVISIEKSIGIMNQFTLICGLIIFVVSMLYAYRLSSSFTKPIREMNKVTQNMKKLNFEQKCSSYSNDEIGALATNINDMSMSLSEAIASMNEQNEQLETLINNVSHELKTPLALLQGYAEGIELNIVRDEEKTKFYAQVIKDEAKKMNRIVESLLNIKRLESGEMDLYYKEFSMADLIKKTVDKYQPLLDREGLDISFICEEDLMVYGDAFYTEQVLMNYLSNAIQYVEAPYRIEVQLATVEDGCRVSVFNSTSHMDDELLKNIWDKFYKLDSARTRDKGGHGLGLSVVKAIQEAYGQAYGVESSSDGIIFWFECTCKKA
jgi:signal transduction histidine kinase